MSRGALVVGGSVAGVQAALDLANSGIEVHLVEPSPFLGNGGATTVPRHLLNARLLELSKHPGLKVWTNTRVSRAEGEVGHIRVELRQHPRYVDLTKCTACEECIEVCPVTVPGTDHKPIYMLEGVQPGCPVIDKLGKAPCSNTCPGGIHVQGYVALVAQGRFEEALDLIRQSIPFPGICGRICTHPCELNCRREEVDEAVSIRLLKRFVSDWELQQASTSEGLDTDLDPSGQSPIPNNQSPVSSLQSPGSTAKRVAVIGAGPAGMAVADNLCRRGYRVSVFEAEPVVGGMMAMGIPAYRLPRGVIHREIKRIEDLGVEIHLETPIGPDGKYTLDDLFNQGYEAVFIGVGAHQGHGLRIPGEEMQGVVSGIELLKAINLSHQTNDPHWQMKVLSYLLGGVATQVAVIGGGNTAMDVARSLKRLGVDDVRVLYRRTRDEMPAMPEEIEEAEHERVPIEFLVAPVRILGNEQGRVVGLECVRMKLGEADHSGRRRPVPIAGSEFTLPLDMVVPAIGQSPNLSFLGKEHPFAITREGTFNVDRVSYMTNRPGVFAAGDAITQPVSVIDAIGSAKQAAAGIDAYLRGVEATEVPFSAREVPIARRELAPEELEPMPRHPSPTIPMARRMRSHAEVELGYDADMAMAEAQRCLMCGPCSECLACEAVCEPKAIRHDQQERFEKLEIGAIIWTDGVGSMPSGLNPDAGEEGLGKGARQASAGPVAGIAPVSDAGAGAGNGYGQQRVYRVEPDDPLAGSAAAARVMMELFAERRRTERLAPLVGTTGSARVGVFVCQCNGQVSGIVDTAAVLARAKTWPGVAYTETMAQSCSQEAADAIYQAVADRDLNRVVLAACSCCAVDQVCYSCTFQRVRCKDNLLGRHFDPGNPLFEFVNIREQCAWLHEGDAQVATATASAMVAAAVAKVRLSGAQAWTSPPLDRTVLILGNGPGATICQEALATQRIRAQRLKALPREIQQTPSHFTVIQTSSKFLESSALVLAPKDPEEQAQINQAFGAAGRQPRAQHRWGGADTHRPGVFICDPSLDARIAGLATAARTAAWLGQERIWPEAMAAVVEPDRCRGCGECEVVCEFGAIQLQPAPRRRLDAILTEKAQGEYVAWIDPAICQGGGICTVHCPAGAIAMEHLSSEQMEAMLEAVLA